MDDFFKQDTIGDLIRLDRKVFIECTANREFPCFDRPEIDLRRFPKDMPIADLKKQNFVCHKCGKSKFSIWLEREREWKRRMKMR